MLFLDGAGRDKVALFVQKWFLLHLAEGISGQHGE